jgi:hypothetical protein
LFLDFRPIDFDVFLVWVQKNVSWEITIAYAAFVLTTTVFTPTGMSLNEVVPGGRRSLSDYQPSDPSLVPPLRDQ